jgi:hypothetical protein
MVNAQKPLAAAKNMSKLPSAGTRGQPKASTKENNQPRSSTATKPTLAAKPPPRQTRPFSSNGAKDPETAALVASLQGEYFSFKFD